MSIVYYYSCCIDLDNHTISYFKNGKDLGIAYSNIDSSLIYYPTVCLRDSKAIFNFGETPFNSCPNGYQAIPFSGTVEKEVSTKRSLLALILEPTRELAQQTYFFTVYEIMM